MLSGSYLYLLVTLGNVLAISGYTDRNDLVGLLAIRDEWKNFPPNWKGEDPCGDNWVGISCNGSNRVVSITLASIGLIGQLSDIPKLSELQILDLSYNKRMTGPLPPTIGSLNQLTSLILVGCGFSSSIPTSIGSLQQLRYLSLNSNNFIGSIPATIGNLKNLYWLDLADNRLTGTIPVSGEGTPGLDMLYSAGHFHFGNNMLSGEIPPQLFTSNTSLIHLLLENNNLTGNIPSTIVLAAYLQVVRLDHNLLSGPVPRSLNNLTTVQELFLSNNRLNGTLPDLTGMSSLSYVDMSNNSFDPTDIPPWFSSLQSLTSLIMENTNIRGQLPSSAFSQPELQTISLKHNRINQTLDIGRVNYSRQLQLVDLQGNEVVSFADSGVIYNFQIILIDNPICTEGGTQSYCTISARLNSSYSTPQPNCNTRPCSSHRIYSPYCGCAYPYTGTLVFRAPSFSNFGNSTNFESLHDTLMSKCRSLSLPVDSVVLSNPTNDINNYLQLSLQFFPSSQDSFDYTGISAIGFMLSNQTFKPPHIFGPYYFIANDYPFEGMNAHKTNMGVIIGAAAGGIVLLLSLILAGVYALRQKRRAETASKKSDPFASWDQNSNSGGIPQLKGAKCFSFEELKKCTNNFSDNNAIGSGGYGKVYRGNLYNGQLVAIKRAQQGSTQGGMEFKTEIELLSRVHHKNVVSLVGFCFDQGEQMLVYEFIVNGTLKDSLSGRSGIRLDWMRRLRIAVGAARGVQYLHDLANPPIIHRDIKSNNILLDERLNAKVADFGLSKPMGDPERDHVTTQVKGTMGYLDPEYYMSNQLTEKSDVYSFGVLLLELLTAKSPIEKGKYIVREVKQAMNKTKDLYGLHGILDPVVASTTAPRSVEKFVDLSLRCVEELGASRPPMSQVVKEIEIVMELAGLNPNAESASTSASYEAVNKGSTHPYSNESLFVHSVAYSPSKLEPK